MNTQTPEEQAVLDAARAELHALIDKAFDTTDVGVIAVVYSDGKLATHSINFDSNKTGMALDMALRVHHEKYAPLAGLAAAQSEGRTQ